MIRNLVMNNISRARRMKRYLATLAMLLIAVAIILCIASTVTTTIAGQTMGVAGYETPFRLSIAYAYVGQGPTNASYTAADGSLMTPITNYPSAIVLNTTRLPDNQIVCCDAIMEVHKIQINTDTGAVENHCYNIGTNFNQSISSTDVSKLYDHIPDLATLSGSAEVIGNFQLNWTQNTSLLSHSVGSIGGFSNIAGSNAYSIDSANGLWRVGAPNVISVTVQRIGYITISNGSISVYKDSSPNDITTTKQLSNYGNGFLYNNLVSAAELQQTNLFHPGN
jgi:hypothetical protein